jgi:ribosomal protein S18 acetylase RimI-like enzyme
MADLNGLVRLQKTDLEPAVRTLVRAFTDYPLNKHYYPDVSQRDRINRDMFSLSFYSGLRYGEMYTVSPEFEGVAIWYPPESYPLTAVQMQRAVPLSVFIRFAWHGGSRMRGVGDLLDDTQRRLVPEPHWFLSVIGVEPEHQGKGCAGRLIRPMLARLDEAGLPCYLDTLDEKNLSVYRHFGFEVIEEAIIPGTPLILWSMLRK